MSSDQPDSDSQNEMSQSRPVPPPVEHVQNDALDQPVDKKDAKGRLLVLFIQSGGTVFLVIGMLIFLVQCTGRHK